MPSALSDKFKNRKPAPKFSDEGEPDMEAAGSGDNDGDEGGSGPPMPPDDDGDEAGGAPGGAPPADPEQQAADDLADILGVGPEDRDDFGAALQAYVQSCLAKSAGPMGPGPGPGDMGPPPGAGGPPPGM